MSSLWVTQGGSITWVLGGTSLLHGDRNHGHGLLTPWQGTIVPKLLWGCWGRPFHVGPGSRHRSKTLGETRKPKKGGAVNVPSLRGDITPKAHSCSSTVFSKLILRFFFFFNVDHFWSLYWICYSISSVLCFSVFWVWSVWDQGLNPQPLHWKVKSKPLDHQGSPSGTVYSAGILWLCLFAHEP